MLSKWLNIQQSELCLPHSLYAELTAPIHFKTELWLSRAHQLAPHDSCATPARACCLARSFFLRCFRSRPRPVALATFSCNKKSTIMCESGQNDQAHSAHSGTSYSEGAK